ncbi:winged helix DNA-binding domain-containing protein [Phytohabitans houttuyneae]|uniref:winged helix DNA-binding domain-containing protein n=1 Tax=Phytohabitans houttuyneae TaxID=1076126 RepID=UPI001565F8C0|nr:winged helix DNA-binding domain-containing protein [Phytohabitans houttuyneae]
MSLIAERRLASVLLAGGPQLGTPAEVVRWFGAVQAQDFGPAKWSLGERLPGTGDAEVQRAFDAGEFLRTHVLRPTWHFVTPDDIRWMLRLTGPRVHATNAYYYRQSGLDDAVFAKAHDLLAEALAGGAHRTRKELAGVIGGAGLPTAGFAMAYILMHAELDGLICSGAMRGKQHTYALLDSRVPPAPERDPDSALAELVTRYFTSHGPATAKDLRWWSSLTLTDIARGVALAGDRLRHEVVDGVSYWSGPPAAARPRSPMAHLVQGYDEYVVAFAESKWVLDASGAARAVPAGTLVPNGVLLLDGQVAGHWRRSSTRDTLLVEALLYRALTPPESAALDAAAARQAAFLGLRPSVATSVLDGAG